VGCFSVVFWVCFVVRPRLAWILGLLWFQSASVGLVFGCLWILVVVGVFLAFRVLWVLLGLSAVFGRVIGFWVCKCSSYTACVLGRLTLSI
jgi:hypothetical protein